MGGCGGAGLDGLDELVSLTLVSIFGVVFFYIMSSCVWFSFDDMLSNFEIPVLVDFYATWSVILQEKKYPLVYHSLTPVTLRKNCRCGPCRVMEKELDEVQVFVLKNAQKTHCVFHQ